MNDRWRCKSIPTNCLTPYSSIGASYDSWNVNTPASAGNVTRSGGPAPSSHQVNWWTYRPRVVLCVVRVESPVPVHVQGAVVLTGGDLVPDGEAVGHLVAPSSGRQQMPRRTERGSDASEHGPEQGRMPGRGAPFHRPLALPGRMMRVLGPVVQTLRLPVFHRGHHHAVSGPVAGELVGNEHPRHVPQSREQSAEELLGGQRVSA